MGEFINPDTWRHLSEAFVSAPYYIILPLVAAAWWVGWWLRGIKSERKIDGLKGEIAVFEAHLKFTAEKVVSANEARDGVIGQFQAYKAEVAANAGYLMPAAMMAKLEAALDKLVAADSAVGSAIAGAARISATTAMNASLSPVGESSVTDTISDLYSNTPLTLRDQAETEKER